VPARRGQHYVDFAIVRINLPPIGQSDLNPERPVFSLAADGRGGKTQQVAPQLRAFGACHFRRERIDERMRAVAGKPSQIDRTGLKPLAEHRFDGMAIMSCNLAEQGRRRLSWPLFATHAVRLVCLNPPPRPRHKVARFGQSFEPSTRQNDGQGTLVPQ
jgi:hypothetical protein